MRALEVSLSYKNSLGWQKMFIFYFSSNLGQGWSGQSAVDEELECLEGACAGTGITGICNAVGTIGDACAVGIAFLKAELTNDLGVGDIMSAIR